MRVSTTLLLAAMAFALGFVAMYIQPASMAALMGQQQAGADCTSVWVNTRSHVYHFAGTSDHGRNFYGNTPCKALTCARPMRVLRATVRRLTSIIRSYSMSARSTP
jgi:hypothetical protein